jgi:mRNA interferase MazF
MKFGDVALIKLPKRKPTGREQEGTRPCLVIANPDIVGRSRYPCLIVAPLTTTAGAWVKAGGKLYPVIEGGVLPASSVVLLDQIQMIDVYRIDQHYGTLTSEESAPVRAGIQALFADLLEVVSDAAHTSNVV